MNADKAAIIQWFTEWLTPFGLDLSLYTITVTYDPYTGYSAYASSVDGCHVAMDLIAVVDGQVTGCCMANMYRSIAKWTVTN